MSTVALAGAGLLLIFVLGVACGFTWRDEALADRNRRQAKVQQEINSELRRLERLRVELRDYRDRDAG